jgi:hypothetical protein
VLQVANEHEIDNEVEIIIDALKYGKQIITLANGGS